MDYLHFDINKVINLLRKCTASDNLIDFYTTAVKVVLNDKETNSEEFDIDDKNFSS